MSVDISVSKPGRMQRFRVEAGHFSLFKGITYSGLVGSGLKVYCQVIFWTSRR